MLSFFSERLETKLFVRIIFAKKKVVEVFKIPIKVAFLTDAGIILICEFYLDNVEACGFDILYH